jgi:transcriptional regulator with XRE-family HTH domain
MSRGTPTTIEVNGYALREIRVRSGVDMTPFAELVGVTRSYLAKIELGRNRRVSPKVYAAILAALDIRDRRTLLANPHNGGWAGDA